LKLKEFWRIRRTRESGRIDYKVKILRRDRESEATTF